MRKMKKINGYLVVKFNARELREYEGTALGEYGVIDAELYTGILDVDRGAMEYDNAGSMEEAVELARGLESELDTEEPEVKVTLVKETDETTEEEEVDAQQMIAGWENTLRGQVASPHYEEAVGYERIKGGYKQALRGRRKYTREAVKYDLFREKNNVDLWRELKSSKYTPGPYHFNVITEPKRRDLSIPQLRDKVVQLVIHEELQNMFRPVFINGSFACQYGRGPIRAAFKVQHDMRVARMKWGDNAAIIKIDARKFFYSIDRALLKKILAKRFKKLKKKRPETYEDLLRFYRLLCKVIDSSPEGETGIPLGNVSSQDFANIYLNELDQFCVRFLGAKLYTRYMDDIVIVAPDKETAREWLAKIKVFLRERLHLDTNKKTKVFYMRQGVNAYGFKIKATHMMLRTESKRREKRRVKAMVRKMKEGKLTRSAVVQAVNSWLGFARWACAYNLAKKIFAPYRFIKTEGAIPYGAISRNRQARRLLQQRRDLEAPYKAVA